MSATREIPHWIKEIRRLARFKSQLYIHGNVKDTVLYPLDVEGQDWHISNLREALFALLGQHVGGFDIIASYNLLDGMRFADEQEQNTMSRQFAELVKGSSAARKPPPEQDVNAPAPAPRGTGFGDLKPLKPTDPIDEAFKVLRQVMGNTSAPCAIIVEHASQMLTAPQNMPLAERMSFLRLLHAAQESQLVRSEKTGNLGRNLLVLVCEKLTDLPAWLYLNNPFSGSIEVPLPKTGERELFFEKVLGGESNKLDHGELAELTDGLSIRELYSISTLFISQSRGGQSESAAAKIADPKELIDHYKYGEQKSEWRSQRLLGKLANAEEFLKQRVIGQDAAVSAVCDVLRRAALGLSGAQHSSRSKPRGVLFFAGPTGVGKTEMAKSITKLVFGEDREPIRFDMSEYGQPHSDQRLLGAPPGYVGYEAGGQLTDQVRTNPFSVLLFDEIEKAHGSILDKFLQILEDGRLTDGRGQTAFFSESIIVFTSNEGAGQLNADDWPNYELLQEEVLKHLRAFFTHELRRPELLNRIGQNIVVFNFIRKPERRMILKNKVLPMIARQVANTHGVELSFSEEVVEKLISMSATGEAAGGRGVGNLAEVVLLNPLSRELFGMLVGGRQLVGLQLNIEDVFLPSSEMHGTYGLKISERQA